MDRDGLGASVMPREMTDADVFGSPSLPRGLRNNNPLNLKATASWSGATGSDGTFSTFATMEDGLAAADRNLHTYHDKHGIDTVAGVVSRWAPPNADGNHTAEYVKHVAGKLGVGPNAALGLDNPEARRALTGAMAEFENGQPLPASAPQAEMSDSDVFGSSTPVEPARSVGPSQITAGRPAGRVSERLGFEQGFSKPYANATRFIKAGADQLGLEAAPWVKDIAHNLQAGQANVEAEHPEVYQASPGKLGTFAGNVAATAAIPGGPLVSGAVSGALLSDKQDLRGVAEDAALGGVTGRLTALGSDALQLGARKLLSKVPVAPTLEALEKTKKDLYSAAHASGFTFNTSDIRALSDKVQREFIDRAGKGPEAAAGMPVANMLRARLAGMAREGNVTLEHLDRLRSDAYEMAVAKGGPDSVIGGFLRREIDKVMDGYNVPIIKEARAANTSWMKAKEIANRQRSGELAAASANSGRNVVNAQRAKIRPTIDPLHGSEVTNWTPDEALATERVVMGGKAGNRYRELGNFFRNPLVSSGGMMLGGMIGGGGGPGGALAGGVAVPATMQMIGHSFRKLAEKETAKDIESLSRLIALGGSRRALAAVPTMASGAVEKAIAALRPALVTGGVVAASQAHARPKEKK